MQFRHSAAQDYEKFYEQELAFRRAMRYPPFSALANLLVRSEKQEQAMKMSASTLTRNLQPLVDAGWVELAAGEDARSRQVSITALGVAKRKEALQRWKVAQEGLNQLLGPKRVLALHQLINESLALLSPVESGADDE